MKKHRAIWLSVAAMSVVVAVLLVASRTREPIYQEKRLSEWLEDFDSFFEVERRKNAEEALRQMGTNVLPFLVRELRARDSWLKRKMLKLTPKPLLVRMPITVFAHVRRERAVAGFRALGTFGRPALPELSGLLNDKETASYAARAICQMGNDAVPPLMDALNSREPAVRSAAAEGLYWLKSDAAPTVPALMAKLKDEQESVRCSAASALGNIGQRGESVIPPLLNALNDPSSSVRDQAVWAIGKFRPEAKAAVPTLLKIAKEDKDSKVRDSAVNALHLIDPETAVTSGLMDPETAALLKQLESKLDAK